jgi:hypothetical protein
MAVDKNQQADGTTIVKDYTGNTVKYGKVKADPKPQSTYEKAQSKIKH